MSHRHPRHMSESMSISMVALPSVVTWLNASSFRMESGDIEVKHPMNCSLQQV